MQANFAKGPQDAEAWNGAYPKGRPRQSNDC